MRLTIATALVALILPACSRGSPQPPLALPVEAASPLPTATEAIADVHVISERRPAESKELKSRPKPPTKRGQARKIANRPTASLKPATVEAGEQEVVVHGHSWGPRSIINIRLVQPGPGRGEFLTFTVPATDKGQFTGRFIVPREVAFGRYLVEVTSRSGGYVALPLRVAPSTNASADEGAGRRPVCDKEPGPGESPPAEGCAA